MIIHNVEQGSWEWHLLRRGIPTASEFGQIVTPKKGEYATAAFTYASRLIADLSDQHYPGLDSYASAAMRNGLELEPDARAWYELSQDVTVQRVGFVTDDARSIGCSPDSLVGDDGGLEVKCPTLPVAVRWLLRSVDAEPNDALPTEHKAQVHGCMVVTGRKWWDFMSYCPGVPPLLVRVEWDDFTEKLAEHLDTFLLSFERLKAEMVTLGWTPFDIGPKDALMRKRFEEEQRAIDDSEFFDLDLSDADRKWYAENGEQAERMFS